MCLQRRFSQEVSSSDACIAPRILDFSQSFAFSGAKFPTFFPPLHQESLVFHRSFPSSDANFPQFSTLLAFPCSDATFLHVSIVLAPLRQESLAFFQDFPSSNATFFHTGPTAPNILGFSQDFPLLMQDCLRSSTFLAVHRIFPRAWPYCAHNCWVFTGFPLLMISQDFPLLMQNFPHTHTNTPPWCQRNL